MMSKLKKANEKWDKYTQGITGTIIYILIGFFIAFIVNAGIGVMLETDTPMVAVFSQSMVPTFQKGDLIVVSGKEADVSIGDIIVFDIGSKDYPIIHRVYDIRKNGDIITKGDNNGFEDPWIVNPESVHGKAWFRVPYLGWIKVFVVEVLSR